MLQEERSKKEVFWMPRNLTIRWYLCFQEHRRRDLNADQSIYSCESILLLKGNSAIQFDYWNDDSEKFKGFKKERF